jgi:hypothetical protein
MIRMAVIAGGEKLLVICDDAKELALALAVTIPPEDGYVEVLEGHEFGVVMRRTPLDDDPF